MCGVIGLIHEHHRPDLGLIAGELLRTLEYRGYDSSGAAIQGEGTAVNLRKDVGAPSVLVEKLGIDKLGGRVLCAQVRWATFGAVNQRNAQPHEVECKTHIYGAHNGNVTNCDNLKIWLGAEGHQVRSDNDGEMVVHTVEHFFAIELAKLGAAAGDHGPRKLAMRAAIVTAGARLRGSYAAVIVDPVSRTLWTIKNGSSLYVGVGESKGSRFAIASSDLSAVLKLTHSLVPISEGQFVELEPTRFQVHRLTDGAPLEKHPVRSRLRAKDTALQAPFSTFMEQEIHAQIETTREVVESFTARSSGPDEVDRLDAKDRALVLAAFDRLRDQVAPEAQRAALKELAAMPALAQALGARKPVDSPDSFRSAERALLAESWSSATPPQRAALSLLDAHLAAEAQRELSQAVDGFCERVLETKKKGGRIFVVCCGSSFHAAKTAALFFAQLAKTELLPLLPGEFRGQYGDNVRDGDLFIAVSQSGETKDLIDVLNDVIKTGQQVARVALVNNLNSTLAQEKCELVIPLRCGPEIAVAATKSFINQLAVFYCLAIAVGERTAPGPALAARRQKLDQLPKLIEQTLKQTEAKVEEAAELLFARPSMHILATRLIGVAKEGALKIREVVLNHTEGFEASEFKHGPNTILGFNTIFGLDQIELLVGAFARGERPNTAEALAMMRTDYPLIYVTGPDPRDVDLIVSQINTHKIRGSTTIILAEEDPAVRGAATKAPADNPAYRSAYVVLPPTGDPMLTVFSATVALQRLALKMSLKKKARLDALGFFDHGVHPDVPKNVSKSITVD